MKDNLNYTLKLFWVFKLFQLKCGKKWIAETNCQCTDGILPQKCGKNGHMVARGKLPDPYHTCTNGISFILAAILQFIIVLYDSLFTSQMALLLNMSISTAIPFCAL